MLHGRWSWSTWLCLDHPAGCLPSLQLVCLRRDEESSSTLNEAFEDFEAGPSEESPFSVEQSLGMSPAAGQDASLGAQDAGEADEAYGDGDADE